MRAGKREFEQRFWIFGGIFFLAFMLYVVDKENSVQWIVNRYVHGEAQQQRAAQLLLGIASALVLLAALFRTWATAYLKTEIVHDQSQHADSVVADGPYRHTRNPLYFGNLIMALGVGPMASRSGWLVMVLGMWIYGYRLIGREEELLLATQGQSYRRFLAAVPRFWPSLTPRLPASGARPRWAQAFLGESLFWCFGLGELAFALTLQFWTCCVLMAIGFVLYFGGVRMIRKGAST